MKSKLPVLLFIFCGWISAASAADPAQTSAYQYFVDLSEVHNDALGVELITPALKKSSVKFYLPKIVPGTYSVSDFGRFVSDLKAFDQEGQALPVRQLDVNTWQIDHAKLLYRVTYRVDDTFDAGGGNPVSGMAGTNIEADANFLLNGHGFFGYFEDLKEVPFEVTIRKPEGFYGSTALTPARTTPAEDLFRTPNYFHLVDNPLMYCRPDTVELQVGNAEVLVSVYSPAGLVKADYVAERYARLLEAQKTYLGGKLPVNRYAFLMYFYPETLSIGGGALEHNYSSVYCLPDMPQEQAIGFLVDIASHEFFHIVTPLNIHSREIHYFDFNEPEMSRHLWLYEGVTEYFAHHAQVSQGLIDERQFLQKMAQKVQNSRTLYDDELPFTEMSRECLDEHGDQYGNVYEKGALIGMCLDIELRRLSDGRYGLVNLLQDLAQDYGSQRPFKDKRLFGAIRKKTYPEIEHFLETYVDGPTPLPYAEYLAQAGITYEAAPDTFVYTLGGAGLKLDPASQRVVVANAYGLDAFGRTLGYEVGDEFVRMNGRDVPKEKVGAFFQGIVADLKEGQNFTVEVYRKNAAGEPELKTLQAPVQRIRVVRAPRIALNPDAPAGAAQLRQAWLRAGGGSAGAGVGG